MQETCLSNSAGQVDFVLQLTIKHTFSCTPQTLIKIPPVRTRIWHPAAASQPPAQHGLAQ